MKARHLKQLILIVLAGTAIFLLTVLSMGWGAESRFPFKSMNTKFADLGWTVEGSRSGNCMTTPFNMVKVRKGPDGWLIYVTPRDRIVAVHYTIVPDTEQATADLVFFGIGRNDGIEVLVEEPFDPLKHEGPCQFLDLTTN